ncbi:hypothetical protein ACFL2H_03660 [Planctomycetota bacterium]
MTRSKNRLGRIEQLESRRLLAIDIPVPMQIVSSTGGIYASEVVGGFSEEVTSQEFRVWLHANQRLSVKVDPETAVQSRITLLSATGEVVGESEVARDGETSLLPPTVIPTAEVYTIRVDSVDGDTGAFSMALVTNASFEPEWLGRGENDSIDLATMFAPTWFPAESFPVASVWGSRPLETGSTAISERFLTGNLPANWTTYSSDPSGQVRVTDEFSTPGDFELWMDQAAPSDPNVQTDIDVAVRYDATTGRISIEAAAPLGVLQIESASDIFTYADPQNLGGNFFDVMQPNKLVRGGSIFGDTDFGIVAKRNLSLDFLRNDLTFSGAYFLGGSPRIALSDRPVQRFVSTEAVAEIFIGNIAAPVLQFSESTIGRAGGRSKELPEHFEGRINANGVSMSQDGNTWYRVAAGTNLADVARARGIDLQQPIQIKFQSYHNGSMPDTGKSFDDIEIHGESTDDADWYQFSLSDGEMASIFTSILTPEMSPFVPTNAEVNLHDSGGNLIHTIFPKVFRPRESILNNFRDTTSDGLPDTYFIEVRGEGFTYGLSVIEQGVFGATVSNLPADVTVVSTQFSTTHKVGVSIPESDGIVTVEAITPAVADATYTPDANLLMQMHQRSGDWISATNVPAEEKNAMFAFVPTETRDYEIQIQREDALGQAIALVLHGLEPSELLDVVKTVPKSSSLTKEDIKFVLVELNERVRFGTLDATKITIDGIQITPTLDADGRTIRLAVPELGTGEHRVRFDEGAAIGVSGNPNRMFAFAFVVDQEPPHIVESTIQAESVIEPGLQRHEIRFNEPLQHVHTSELFIQSATGQIQQINDLQYDGDTSTLSFEWEPTEGTYTLVLESDFGHDRVGMAIDGDHGTVPSGDGVPGGDFIAPFVVDHTHSVAPHGDRDPYPLSILSDFVEGSISDQSDVDPFAVQMSAGDRFAVLVNGTSAGFSPVLSVVSPVGDVVVEQSSGADQRVATPLITATETGTYQVRVGAGSDIGGQFQLSVFRNGSFEMAESLRESNGSLESASALDSVFADLPIADASFASFSGDFTREVVAEEDFERFHTGLWELSKPGLVIEPQGFSPFEGDRSLVMNGGTAEAIWKVPVPRNHHWELSFAHLATAATDRLPEQFSGSVVGNGVSVSVDGQRWIRLFEPRQSEAQTWQTTFIDARSPLDDAGWQIGQELYFKFQFASELPHGRRAFDAIRLTSYRDDTDWYSFTLNDDETSSIDAYSRGGSQVPALELFDSSGRRISYGENGGEEASRIHEFRDLTSNGRPDRYYLRLTGVDPYVAHVTRGTHARFSNDHPDPLSDSRGWLSQFDRQIVDSSLQHFPVVASSVDESDKTWLIDGQLFVSDSDLETLAVFERENGNWQTKQLIANVPNVHSVATDSGLLAISFRQDRVSVIQVLKKDVGTGRWEAMGEAILGKSQSRRVAIASGNIIAAEGLSSSVYEYAFDATTAMWQLESQFRELASSLASRNGDLFLGAGNTSIYRKMPNGKWVNVQEIPGQSLTGVARDVLVTYGGGIKNTFYRYSETELKWIEQSTVQTTSQGAGDGVSSFVHDDFVLIASDAGLLYPIHRAGDSWIADEPIEFADQKITGDRDGTIATASRSSGTVSVGNIATWQNESSVYVEKGGALHVDTIVFEEFRTPDSVLRVQVVDENENVIGQNDYDSAAALNRLTANVPATGKYTVRTLRRNGGFAYQVNIVGDVQPFDTLSLDTFPRHGAVLNDVPDITLSFSNNINQADLSTDAVEIDGKRPVDFTVVDRRTVVFHFDSNDLPDDSNLQFNVNEGTFVSVEGYPNPDLTIAFRIDSYGPTVAESFLVNDSVIDVGDHRFEFRLSEPIDASSISTQGLSLDGSRTGKHVVSRVSYDPEELRLTIDAVRLQEDHYTLSLISGENGIRDLVGNYINETRGNGPFSDYVLRFHVDSDVTKTAMLERVQPVGSLIFKHDYATWLHSADDVDVLAFDTRENVPYAFKFEVSDVDAKLVATIGATQYAIRDGSELSAIVFGEPGVVALRLQSDGPTSVAVTLLQNAVMESDIGAARLDASRLAVGGGERYGAMGSATVNVADANLLFSRTANSEFVRVDPQSLVAFGSPIQVQSDGFVSATDGASVFAFNQDFIFEHDMRGRLIRTIEARDRYNNLEVGTEYVFASTLTSVDMFDKQTGSYAGELTFPRGHSPRTFAAKNDQLYYFHDDSLWKFDVDSSVSTRVFDVSFPITFNQLAATVDTFYGRRSDTVYAFSNTGELIGTTEFRGAHLFGFSKQHSEDVDRFTIPVDTLEPITITVASAGQPIGHAIRFANQNGDPRQSNITTQNDSGSFIAQLQPDAGDSGIDVVIESTKELAYAIYAAIGIEHSPAVVGTLLGSFSPRETLDVVHPNDIVWIADGDSLIQYDTGNWKAIRRIKTPIEFQGNDHIATDGRHVFVKSDERLFAVDPLNPESAFEVLSLHRTRVPEVVDGQIVGFVQQSAVAREIERSFTVRRGRIDVFEYQTNRPTEFLERFTVPEITSFPFGVSYANGHLYIGLPDGTILSVDPHTGDVVNSVKIPVETRFFGLAAYSPTPVSNANRTVGAHPQLTFDRESYAIWSDIEITLLAQNIAGSEEIQVTIAAPTGDEENVTLTESSLGVFRGTIASVARDTESGDGFITTRPNGVVIVTYSHSINGNQDFAVQHVPILDPAAVTPPAVSFDMTAGQYGVVTVDLVGRSAGSSNAEVLAHVVNETTGNSVTRLLTESSSQLLVQANGDSRYSLYLDGRSNETMEVLRSVQVAAPDVDGNGQADTDDLDRVCSAIHSTMDLLFDVNLDERVDGDDVSLLRSLLGIPVGDANGDGRFNSTDFVTVFQAAQYEDSIPANSTWSTGDWNCDGEFSTSDFVSAFQAGQYAIAASPVNHRGNQNAIAAVFADYRDLVDLAAERNKTSHKYRAFLP